MCFFHGCLNVYATEPLTVFSWQHQDKSLEKKSWAVQSPVYTKSEFAEEAAVDDDAEADGSDVEENLAEDESFVNTFPRQIVASLAHALPFTVKPQIPWMVAHLHSFAYSGFQRKRVLGEKREHGGLIKYAWNMFNGSTLHNGLATSLITGYDRLANVGGESGSRRVEVRTRKGAAPTEVQS